MNYQKPLFEVDLQRRECFPIGFERGDLIDITTITDTWKKFVNRYSGKIIDCAEYAKQAGL